MIQFKKVSRGCGFAIMTEGENLIRRFFLTSTSCSVGKLLHIYEFVEGWNNRHIDYLIFTVITDRRDCGVIIEESVK